MLNNIGFVSYVTGAVAFLVLFLVLLTGGRGRTQKRWLAGAAIASTAWAAVAAYQSTSPSASILASQLLEPLRDLALLQFLVVFLALGHQHSGTPDKRLRRISHVIYVLAAITFGLTLSQKFGGYSLILFDSIDFAMGAYLMLATTGLVLVEQLFRNARAEAMRATKYLCLGMGGVFAYDFYLYADALMFQRIDPSLWYARGFVNALVIPVIGIALARDPHWSPDIFVSRRIVFHTTTLFFAGVYLLAMGFGGYYVRDVGGSWGAVAQASLLFAALMALLILYFSGPLRARLRVLINKHFFQYKYDYREEWLRFIRTLSSSEQNVPLPERVIRAMAQMLDCPGGVLWVRRDNGWFEPEARWNMELPPLANEPADSSLVRFLEIQKWVISLDEYRRDPGLYKSLGDLEMPSWLQSVPNAWLISPLVLHERLLGFVVLARSPARHQHFNWEDSDLLKTSGSEAASHLAQHTISQALAEARQYEEFNKLSTYVIHDLKNLISQLSLVVSNAARHRNNPLFMENVISTVENSVSKMNRLLVRMRDGVQVDSARMINLAKLLEEVVRDAQTVKPAPVFECQVMDINITADRDRLASVMGHVIRNAQDATPEGGRVVVRLQRVNGHAVVEVEDTGCGMDESFIQARLFRPFQTTKGKSGMGIGACEAREFVRSMGGDIHVNSKPGVGTVFRIHLPYHAVAEPTSYRQQNLH